VGGAFLAGYLEGAGSSGLLPESDDDLRMFLAALLMEKALYEVEYELENRPGWVGVPLQGILDALPAAAAAHS
jgi:maltose alpha-D-glucosyltransferase/alpha-amylase